MSEGPAGCKYLVPVAGTMYRYDGELSDISKERLEHLVKNTPVLEYSSTPENWSLYCTTRSTPESGVDRKNGLSGTSGNARIIRMTVRSVGSGEWKVLYRHV